MRTKYHFSYQPDWRNAPAAFWVHRPVAGSDRFDPRAPPAVPHKGFVFLHVEFGAIELRFSAHAQLDHFIDTLAKKPLPTSRALSAQRGLPVGPNGHWLSRLPASLKSPHKRMRLVKLLKEIRASVVAPDDGALFRIAAAV
jgi:hypothetical protein